MRPEQSGRNGLAVAAIPLISAKKCDRVADKVKGRMMLGHFLTKVLGKASKNEVLAKYRLDVGMLQPRYESLKDLEINRDVSIEGLPANLDVWNFQFESCAFRLVINPNIHVLDPDPFGRGRLVAAFGRKSGEEDFTPLDDRFWFRQLDSLRDMMPELDSLFPPRA